MVYAGGDAVTGAATVILAMAPARKLPARLKRPSRRRNSNNKNFPCTFTQAQGKFFMEKSDETKSYTRKSRPKIVVGSIMAAYGLTLAVYAGFGGATLAIFWQ